MNFEAGNELSAFVARKLSGLPYEKSKILRTNTLYESINHYKKFDLSIEYNVQELLTEKTALDHWLTERYCLYIDQKNDVFRYDVHHVEWKINSVNISSLKVNYKIGDFHISNQPDFTHYSKGVKVLAWKRMKV